MKNRFGVKIKTLKEQQHFYSRQVAALLEMDLNYHYLFIFIFGILVSCSRSNHIVSSKEATVSPNLTKSKSQKLDSINVISVPLPIKNKAISKPDENAPKSRKGVE